MDKCSFCKNFAVATHEFAVTTCLPSSVLSSYTSENIHAVDYDLGMIALETCRACDSWKKVKATAENIAYEKYLFWLKNRFNLEKMLAAL